MESLSRLLSASMEMREARLEKLRDVHLPHFQRWSFLVEFLLLLREAEICIATVAHNRN
jgi:hypothetical protein